ncbi:MAG: hypothetical protein A3K75_01045 [Euryarchaeota archaeon RBG_13_61_15]|nr:MAG: hypothetical protein A3K75_01045 [Euryarchaeota archaeon RBG_13_61_15]
MLCRALAALTCCIVLSAALSPSVRAEDYALVVNPGDTGIGIISGNLTAAVTYDWPRIIFWHTVDPWTPTFEAGIPRIYLYNDTNEDGVFARSEAAYTVYLDSNHVDWNLSQVDSGVDEVNGSYAQFGMTGSLSASKLLDNGSMVEVSDWAVATFWFSITENSTVRSSSVGSYVVNGKTDIRTNMTLRINRQVNATGAAMEQTLQGGGSNSVFLLKQASREDDVALVEVSGRVDETDLGENFTHSFAETGLPMQEIEFAKDDRTVQAHYEWNSMYVCETNGTEGEEPLRSSYYTTGSGLVLHSAFLLPDANSTVTMDTIVGIDEAGFAGRMRDWVKENLPEILALSGLMACGAGLSFWFARKRKKLAADTNQPKDKMGDP